MRIFAFPQEIYPHFTYISTGNEILKILQFFRSPLFNNGYYYTVIIKAVIVVFLKTGFFGKIANFPKFYALNGIKNQNGKFTTLK